MIEARRAVVPDGSGFAVRHARLHLDGATIRTVELDPTTPPPPGADDVGDRLLTPAFINAHTHLALVALRGPDVGAAAEGNMVESLFFRVEEQLTRDDVYALTLVGAYESLLTGTAVVWDHYYHADAVAEALQDAGLAGIVGPALQDLAGPGRHGSAQALALTAALAQRTDLKELGIGVCVAPHATDTVSDALLGLAADCADRWQLPVHLHVAQSLEEVERAHQHAGTTPLGRLHRQGVLTRGTGWLLVHGLFLTDADLALLDHQRHTLVACPSAQALFGFPAHVPSWQAAGVPWVAATDCAAANDSMNVQKELRALAAYRTGQVPWTQAHHDWRRTGRPEDAHRAWAQRQHGLAARAPFADPSFLLHRVWTLPGRLHPQLPCGRIAPGHLAHLALWDTHHPSFWPGDDVLRALALGDTTQALCQIMVAGRWRGTRDDLHRSLLGEAAWQQGHPRALAARSALLQRAGY